MFICSAACGSTVRPNAPVVRYCPLRAKICNEDTPDAYLPVIRGQLLVHRSRDGGRSWQALGHGLPQQESCAVLREALDIDDATPCGLYLATNRGHVFASADEGDSWRMIAELGASVRMVRARAS